MSLLVRAASLTGYEELAQSLGLDVADCCRRAGVERSRLADADALLTQRSIIALLEISAADSGRADFGLLLAERQGIDILGPLGVLLRHQATLADALQQAARYLFMHNPALRLSIGQVPGRDDLCDIVFDFVNPQATSSAQILELTLGVSTRALRLLGHPAGKVLTALLPHARQGPAATYKRVLGCPCEFNAAQAALRLASADLERPLPQHHPLLQTMAQQYLDQQFGAPTSRLADQIQLLLRRLLGVAPVTQQVIAAELGLHPRTLQRRLVQEGEAFEQLLDALRRERFEKLMRQQPALGLLQVAQMLGYAEQAALTRSCRRWFDCTPSELRRRSA